MAAVDVLNSAGAKVSEVELPDEIFSIPVKTSVSSRSRSVSARIKTGRGLLRLRPGVWFRVLRGNCSDRREPVMPGPVA